MVGNMQHPGIRTVVVITHKVKIRMIGHIGGRHRDIFIAADISAGRIIDFIIRAGCNGKSGYVAFTVVHHRMNIRWKDRLVFIVDADSRIGPP